MTPERVRSISIITFSIALGVSHDLYLFHFGKSWTPLQYESIIPLLLLGQTRYIALKAVALSLLIISSKILNYEFGLSFNLILESLTATILFLGVLSASIAASVREAFRGFHLTTIGIVLIISAVVTDKTIAGDKLFASYLLPQVKYGLKPYAAANPLRNEIAASIKESGTILIVWESLGWPKDVSAITAFTKQNPTSKIQRIEHEGGSTLTAEFRYLCGSNSGVMDYADCVAHGNRSVALHGNSLSYFQRQFEYPKMGFQEFYGRHELSDLPLCRYAYNAVCDHNLINSLIKTALLNQCKGLFYALTIDSHFPYKKYRHHVSGLLQDVTDTLKKLKQVQQAYPDCNIVIIGDHPPPVSTDFDPKAVMRIDIH